MTDFEAFHRGLAPEPGLGRAVGRDAGLTFQLGDRSWTYRRVGDDIVVEPDADGECVVSIDDEAWAMVIGEELSLNGLMYTGRLTFVRGGFDDVGAWLPALQHLWYGRRIYEPASIPFDPPRAFTPADDDGDMAEALARYGFVHVRGVFSEDEIEVMRRDVDRAIEKARPDDGRSWWATTRAGEEVCCRVNYLSEQSAAIDALTSDARLQSIADLSGVRLQPFDDSMDGHSVVIKHFDVAEGLSDLPWHIDCGLGGHDLLCPAVNIGIQLDAASPEHGQVHYLPGSVDTSVPGNRPSPEWQTFAVATEPGDVTAHLGHVLHFAPPPTEPGPGRRALYVTFHRPELRDVTGRGQAYNDVLFQEGSGRIRVPD